MRQFDLEIKRSTSLNRLYLISLVLLFGLTLASASRADDFPKQFGDDAIAVWRASNDIYAPLPKKDGDPEDPNESSRNWQLKPQAFLRPGQSIDPGISAGIAIRAAHNTDQAPTTISDSMTHEFNLNMGISKSMTVTGDLSYGILMPTNTLHPSPAAFVFYWHTANASINPNHGFKLSGPVSPGLAILGKHVDFRAYGDLLSLYYDGQDGKNTLWAPDLGAKLTLEPADWLRIKASVEENLLTGGVGAGVGQRNEDTVRGAFGTMTDARVAVEIGTKNFSVEPSYQFVQANYRMDDEPSGVEGAGAATRTNQAYGNQVSIFSVGVKAAF